MILKYADRFAQIAYASAIAASGRVIASFVSLVSLRIDAPHGSPYDAAACDFMANSVQIAKLLPARSELQVIREADKMNIDCDPNH